MTDGVFVYDLQGENGEESLEQTKARVPENPGSENPDQRNRSGNVRAVITGLLQERRHLQVPEILGGAPVREIAPHAFSGQMHLRSLSLPCSLASVGAFALHNCPELTELSLHDGIRDFHNGVLRQDLKLRRIHFHIHEGNYTVMRDILSDSDARFQFCLHMPQGEARLLFPGYDYAFAENTMARTIQFTISGSGMFYRECVRRKGVGFREYDRLFARVIPDDPHAAVQIAADRLLFPYDLAPVHAEAYESYLGEMAGDALVQFVTEVQTDPESGYMHLRLMADRGMISREAADAALRMTSEYRMTEASGIILAGRVKNNADALFFTPEVCVEAPQTSADPIGETSSAAFSSGVSAQECFDTAEREKASADKKGQESPQAAGQGLHGQGRQENDAQKQGHQQQGCQEYDSPERAHRGQEKQETDVSGSGFLTLDDW